MLFTENLVALLPSDHRLAHEKTLKLSQLQDEPFILFPKGFILREIIVDACKRLEFNPNVAFEGEDMMPLRGWCLLVLELPLSLKS